MSERAFENRRLLPTPRNLQALQESVGLIGESEPMHQILQTVLQVASSDITVLITGESGTGKELIARAIHKASQRVEKPLVNVNCGAIPEGILESELFGHEKGAFTGAVGARKGYFELADSGTIFLDEIGEMPLPTQVKLLRVLEGGDFMRVGGTVPRFVDVRVIAATNKHLELEVRKGNFRQDLFYRLNAVNIRVPSLRERKKDIRLLADKFVADFCRDNKIIFNGFTESAYQVLENYPWPGNIRELKNIIERSIVLEKGHQVDEYTIQQYLSSYQEPGRNLPMPLNKSAEELERELLYRALQNIREEIHQLREIIFSHLFPPKQIGGWQPPVVTFDASAGREVPFELYKSEEAIPLDDDDGKKPDKSFSLMENEKRLITSALEFFHGNKRMTARALDISERTLYRKIKDYNLPY